MAARRQLLLYGGPVDPRLDFHATPCQPQIDYLSRNARGKLAVSLAAVGSGDRPTVLGVQRRRNPASMAARPSILTMSPQSTAGRPTPTTVGTRPIRPWKICSRA